MKLIFAVYSFFIIFSTNLYSENENVYIAPFSGDRKAAVTYTFDDGLRSQFTKALPVLDELNLKATFFIVPGVTPDVSDDAKKKRIADWGSVSWDEWKKVAANGHEIGNHSLEHKNLAAQSEAEIRRQVDEAQKLIKQKLGITALTFCYPYNSRNKKVDAIVDPKFPFSRKSQVGFGGKITSKMMNDRMDKAVQKGSWEIIMIHAINIGYDQFRDPQQLYDHWRYVKSKESELWVDTFANIGKYKAMAKAVKLEVKQGNQKITCSFTGIKKDMLESHLTIVAKAKNALEAKAIQAGKNLKVRTTIDKILIDVDPMKGPFEISWK